MSVQEELSRQEKEIVEAAARGDLSVAARLLDDDFLEIGSTGRLYTKSEVLDAMKDVQVVDCSFVDFRALAVSADCIIVTYITRMTRRQQGREFPQRSYRSSTWVRREGAWRIIFHQATPLPDSQ